MIESDRIVQRVNWLDRAATLALIGGFALPFVVVGILVASGWPLGALGGIIIVGWWFGLGLFLLLRTLSLWQSKKTHQEHDPQLRRIRFRAYIYATLFVVITVVPVASFLYYLRYCCAR